MRRKILGSILVSSVFALTTPDARAYQAPDDPPGNGGERPDAANLINTRIVGGEGDTAFQEVGQDRAILVGFRVQTERSGDIEVVKVVQPVFLNAKGHKISGNKHGRVQGSEFRICEARKGYVVGAITVQAGKSVDGFSITYMKMENGRLNPDDAYDSEWIGAKTTQKKVNLASARPVTIGMLGRIDDNGDLSGLGLVFSNDPIGGNDGKIDPSDDNHGLEAHAAEDRGQDAHATGEHGQDAHATEVKRVPPPSGEALAKGLKDAKEVYGDEWAAAKTTELKKALVRKLLKAANDSEGDTDGKYVLLKLAKEIAAQAGDCALSFDAVDRMGAAFEIDVIASKTNVLAFMVKHAHDAAEHHALAEQGLTLIDQAAGKDKYAELLSIEDVILQEARTAHDPKLLAEVKLRLEECKLLAKDFEAMRKATAVLEKTPDDPAANLAVGRYLCFVKGDWAKGVPLLATSSNAKLKAAALKDVAAPATSADQAALGDLWWSLAEKEPALAQKHIRERANYWYVQSLPGLAGLTKAKVEKRIKEIDDLYAAASGKANNASDAQGKGRYRPGLVAELYNDTQFAQRITSRVDGKIDFNWGIAPPDPQINNSNFAIRWRGYLKVAKAGKYILYTNTHSGIRFTVDNVILVDKMTTEGQWQIESEVTFTAGYHPVEVEFLQGLGSSWCRIAWLPPGETASAIIAPSCFSHDAQTEQGAGLGQR